MGWRACCTLLLGALGDGAGGGGIRLCRYTWDANYTGSKVVDDATHANKVDALIKGNAIYFSGAFPRSGGLWGRLLRHFMCVWSNLSRWSSLPLAGSGGRCSV